MSFSHSPKIVTDGLVLALDAGNTKSYVSGSTTWFDKSGFSNNGTLTNGPTFSSANGGSIVFDGVDDYILVPNSTVINLSSELTLSFFIRKNTNVRMWYVDKHSGGQSGFYGFIDSNNSISFYFGNSFPITTDPNVLSSGQWYNITITGNATSRAIYVNGVQSKLITDTTTWNQSNEPFVFGNTLQLQGSVNGNITTVNLYSRALNALEVQQNFNALRGRFGI
jgi:hypothetical protein